jgi:hypothetical protein
LNNRLATGMEAIASAIIASASASAIASAIIASAIASASAPQT